MMMTFSSGCKKSRTVLEAQGYHPGFLGAKSGGTQSWEAQGGVPKISLHGRKFEWHGEDAGVQSAEFQKKNR